MRRRMRETLAQLWRAARASEQSASLISAGSSEREALSAASDARKGAALGSATIAAWRVLVTLTSSSCDGGSSSEVSFMPFEQAFGEGLTARIADAKAKGSRVCFCR